MRATDATTTAITSSFAIFNIAYASGYIVSESACHSLARAGGLEQLQFIKANVPDLLWSHEVTDAAAAGGNLTTLQWLLENDVPLTTKTAQAAARGGHVHVLAWLLRAGVYDKKMFSHAGAGGMTNVLQWLHDIPDKNLRRLGKFSTAVTSAAATGQVETLKWLIDHGFKTRNHDITAAAQGGFTECVELIYPHVVVGLCDDAVNAAAGAGNAALVGWLVDHQFPTDRFTCEIVAKMGDVHLLERIRVRGEKLNRSICRGAAAGGHLHVLQYAKDNGYRGGEDACRAAAGGGHLEALKHIHADGALLTQFTFTQAARFGDVDVLEWLWQQDCPWSANTYAAAAAGGHLHALQWLRERGCQWNAHTITEAAEYGRLDIVM
ncbi:hypothetical protein JKP88DRAFT_174683 [Tribonema minus]|uniref:Ankyrin repeat protein n=1 Tax=Tribonema minus TaxID=303371 RepID=A0A835ZHB7_9STRA|nr:hypothetical protein JKP88DRAFT_174683 [Tribonema minus]